MQELDSRLDALAHQRRTLPEIAALADRAAQRRQLDDRARDLRVSVDDLTAEQKKADREVEQVRTRRERDRSRMDQGLIGAKDLERMGHEMVSLERRISTLEDEELEVMQRLEDAQADLDRVTEELAGVDQDVAALTVARDEKATALDAEITGVRAQRVTAAEGLPEDLVALYERLRASKGGVGAAALRRRECTGCRLTLNAADLAVIAKAPSDEVVRCEECDRILVRTAESGLAPPA